MPPDALLEQVYDELRRLAAARLAREAPGHTLDATALVHEAWLRLADASVDWQDRTHFLRVAAVAMRRILVDQARAKRTAKRGGDAARVSLDPAAPTPPPDLPALGEALEKLAAVKPDHAELITLRFFAGLTGDEAAAALNLSPATADRMWRYARAWLQVELSRTSKDQGFLASQSDTPLKPMSAEELQKTQILNAKRTYGYLP